MLDFGFYNMDCMEGMKEFPDKYFDLAIVDPPYGDAGGGFAGAERFGGRFDKYRGGAIPRTGFRGKQYPGTSRTESEKGRSDRNGGSVTKAAKKS